MTTARSASSGNSTVSLHEFLATDFARIDQTLIHRCMKVDGQRIYLSGATGFFGKNILALLFDLQRRGASFRVTALSRAPERFLAEQPWCRTLSWSEWRQGNALEPWPGEGSYDLLVHAATDTAASSHVDKLEVFEGILSATRRALAFGADLAIWLLVLLLEAPRGATVNVGSDRGIRVIELATRVRDLVNPQLAIQRGAPRPGEERQFYVPSIDNARAQGLDAWTGLGQAILRAALWHRRATPVDSLAMYGAAK